MEVKIFGSMVADYEKTFEKWLSENKDVQIKNVAIGLGQASDWVLTVVLFEDGPLLSE